MIMTIYHNNINKSHACMNAMKPYFVNETQNSYRNNVLLNQHI